MENHSQNRPLPYAQTKGESSSESLVGDLVTATILGVALCGVVWALPGLYVGIFPVSCSTVWLATVTGVRDGDPMVFLAVVAGMPLQYTAYGAALNWAAHHGARRRVLTALLIAHAILTAAGVLWWMLR